MCPFKTGGTIKVIYHKQIVKKRAFNIWITYTTDKNMRFYKAKPNFLN
jgi:hypothetical protein